MNDLVIRELDETIRLSPKDAAVYLNRGDAYLQKGCYDKAIEDYDKAIELDPKNAIAYNGRGIVHENRGDYDKAINDYNKAIELDPKYVRAYNNRGTVYQYRKNQLDKAIVDYNRAIELAPGRYAALYINRGYAYDKKGDYTKAVEDYDNAVRICPYSNDLINEEFGNWPSDEVDEDGKDEVDRVSERLEKIVKDYINSGNEAAAAYYSGVSFLFTGNKHIARENFETARKLGFQDRVKLDKHLENLKSRF